MVDGLGNREVVGAILRDGILKVPMGGYMSELGIFRGIGINGYYWTSTNIFNNFVSNMVLSQANSVIYFNYSRFDEGLSVRCVAD